MQQVLVIHGGTTFDSHEEYMTYLKTRAMTLEYFARNGVGWKANLQQNLGDEYQVLLPKMPNGTYAKYDEWKIWFERIVSLLDDGVILVGHSLGAIFLVKYLSENTLPVSVKGTLLVGSPFGDTGEETLGGFMQPERYELLLKQGGLIKLYASTDDDSVPMSHLEEYKKALPTVESQVFSDRGHFQIETFPELEGDIRRLTS